MPEKLLVTAEPTTAASLAMPGTKYLTSVIPFNREKSYRLFSFYREASEV